MRARSLLLVAAVIASAASIRVTGSERLEEVTVTAQRAELAPKAREFVTQIARPEIARAMVRDLAH